MTIGSGAEPIETTCMKRPKAGQVCRRDKLFDLKRTREGRLKSIRAVRRKSLRIVGDPGVAAHSTCRLGQNNPRGYADIVGYVVDWRDHKGILRQIWQVKHGSASCLVRLSLTWQWWHRITCLLRYFIPIRLSKVDSNDDGR